VVLGRRSKPPHGEIRVQRTRIGQLLGIERELTDDAV
jgi:hypothetical protein